MITRAIEPALFTALRVGFEAGIQGDAPPISALQLGQIRSALAAGVSAARRGRPILMVLESTADLYALSDCFAVGGEDHPQVTEAQWDAINELLDKAASAGD